MIGKATDLKKQIAYACYDKEKRGCTERKEKRQKCIQQKKTEKWGQEGRIHEEAEGPGKKVEC